jgi:phosphatase NudJ
MARKPIPTFFAVMVVVKMEARYLMVREKRFDQKWYLPAGRVEPGEDLFSAAQRETLEESGLEVQLDGIIRLEHEATADYSRVRAIFFGHPTGNGRLKTVPDEHTLGAQWLTLEEIRGLTLRWDEVLDFVGYVEENKPIYPLAALSTLAPA